MTGGQALGLAVLPGASPRGVLTPLGLSLAPHPRGCTAGLEAPQVPYDLSPRALRYDALVVLLPGRESLAVLKGLSGFFQASVGVTAACALRDSPGPQPTLRVSEHRTGLQMHPVHPPHAGTGGTSRAAHTRPGYGIRSIVARPAGKCVDSGCSVTVSPLPAAPVLQLQPPALQAPALWPQDLPPGPPGVLPPQQLLLSVPAHPPHLLPAALQDAAPAPRPLRNRSVTPAPVAQPPTHQTPKIIKSPLCTKLDTCIESWFTVSGAGISCCSAQACCLQSIAPLSVVLLRGHGSPRPTACDAGGGGQILLFEKKKSPQRL